MTRKILKISKFDDPGFLPKGLEFSLSKLEKIDDHLYRFYISHDSAKYIYFSLCTIAVEDGLFKVLNFTDKESASQKEYKDGTVHGGSIKISGKASNSIFIKTVDLKNETMVFIIIDPYFLSRQSLF